MLSSRGRATANHVNKLRGRRKVVLQKQLIVVVPSEEETLLVLNLENLPSNVHTVQGLDKLPITRSLKHGN